MTEDEIELKDVVVFGVSVILNGSGDCGFPECPKKAYLLYQIGEPEQESGGLALHEVVLCEGHLAMELARVTTLVEDLMKAVARIDDAKWEGPKGL